MTQFRLSQWIFGLFVLVISLSACKKTYQTIEEIDNDKVQAYLQQSGLTTILQYNDTGIYYEVISQGNGAPLEYTDKVPLIYTVRSLDGSYAINDPFAGTNRYASFLGYFSPEKLNTLVKEKLKRGGVMRVILPSRYAYGKNGQGSIPGNASLDYTITTLDEMQQPAYDESAIQKYISDNGLSGFNLPTSSGIHYQISGSGSGTSISLTSKLNLEYGIKLLNGTVIAQTESGAGLVYRLDATLPAWKEIIQTMQPGQSVRMLVPSKMAYGFPDPNRPNLYAPFVSVPAFSCLDFTVKVISIVN